ncbi:MAG: type II secretion system protein [Sedimentisphaerales bacterium]|nr:type II secretion system protein [Sedimentisphaerales bacterium]
MPKRKKAFTLIELLVVISIIALLVSILMPSLGRAREQAKLLLCQMNMKSLIQAFMMYAGDNEDRMISAGTFGGNYPPANSYWTWLPTRLDEEYPMQTEAEIKLATEQERQEGIKRGALFPYCQNVKTFNCRGDRSGTSKNGAQHYRSYSMPDGINQTEMEDTGYQWFEPLYKLGSIKNPTEKILFLEDNDYYSANMGAFWIPPPETNNWYDILAVWHFGNTSFGFVDGHCETKAWSLYTQELFKAQGVSGNLWGASITDQEGREDARWVSDRCPLPRMR